MRTHHCLRFGTAGIPKSATERTPDAMFRRLRELGLDAMELEYVRGTFPGDAMAREYAAAAVAHDIALTAHGPYYINLNAREPEKRAASRRRIIATAHSGSLSGAWSATFHPGFYLGDEPEHVYGLIRDELVQVMSEVRKMGAEIDIRPETTGKQAQFGTLDELVRLSMELDGVCPCVDWAHLHAKHGGVNTAAEFQAVLDTLAGELGDTILRSMHMHVSGIEFTATGERRHLPLDESDFNYRDLLRILRDNDVAGVLISESPDPEADAVVLATYYRNLSS